MDNSAEGYCQGGWGYGFGSKSFQGSDNFDDGIARTDQLDVGLALGAYDGGRTESAFAGCGRLHVGDPVEETGLVCYQRTGAWISPDRSVGTIFTLIREADPTFLQVVVVGYLWS